MYVLQISKYFLSHCSMFCKINCKLWVVLHYFLQILWLRSQSTALYTKYLKAGHSYFTFFNITCFHFYQNLHYTLPACGSPILGLDKIQIGLFWSNTKCYVYTWQGQNGTGPDLLIQIAQSLIADLNHPMELLFKEHAGFHYSLPPSLLKKCSDVIIVIVAYYGFHHFKCMVKQR